MEKEAHNAYQKNIPPDCAKKWCNNQRSQERNAEGDPLGISKSAKRRRYNRGLPEMCTMQT